MIRGSVVADEQLLEEAVRRLVERLRPERIYLFGSRARGDAAPDSDYDFLVVLPDDTPIARRELERIAYHALSGLGTAHDVLVQTRAQFEYYLPVVASLAATVAREGRLLHGPPTIALEAVSLMDLEVRKAELTRQWLSKAQQDLETADRMAQPPPLPSVVAFHSQQAAEKALKGYLTWHDQSFEKTHQLETLVRQCADIAADFATLLEAAKTLTPYAVAGRYPPSEVADRYPRHAVAPSRELADEARRLARMIVAFVQDNLPPHTRP